MTARLNTGVVPEAARPPAVASALQEVEALRDRFREAQEAAAATEQELATVKAEDVAAAAQKVREGAAPGAVPAHVRKAESAVEAAQRAAAAIGLAADQASTDAAAAITESGPAWLAALDKEQDRARERGLQAVAELEEALRELRATASASNWLRSCLSDSRFDRPLGSPLLGAAAPSSRKVTANSQALGAAQLLAFVGELLAPLTTSPVGETTAVG